MCAEVNGEVGKETFLLCSRPFIWLITHTSAEATAVAAAFLLGCHCFSSILKCPMHIFECNSNDHFVRYFRPEFIFGEFFRFDFVPFERHKSVHYFFQRFIQRKMSRWKGRVCVRVCVRVPPFHCQR